MTAPIPDFEFEKKLWRRGVITIGGADEVGRGSFAGPVVCAICGFSSEIRIPKDIVIRDSKLLTHSQRKKAYYWLIENSSFWAVGDASVTQINKIGIKRATDIAFRKAVKNAQDKVSRLDHLLVDAFYIPYLAGLSKKYQTPITRGDQKSISIAAASIIAKFWRDKIMLQLGRYAENKKYDWINNKGYGTRTHRQAILTHGINKHHRSQFVNTFLRKHEAKS
jgi:ribonuclease HII